MAMSVMDRAVLLTSNWLPMRRRMAAVKRYNQWRKGEYEEGRRRLYWEARAKQPADWIPNAPLRDGYSVDDSRSLPFLDAVIQDCKKIFDENRAVSGRKDFLINQLKDQDLDSVSSLLAFATSRAIVSVAAEYLDMIPVLGGIELWRSEDLTQAPPRSSQLFHLDNADLAQVKVFVCIRDVHPDAGPFGFVPQTASRYVCETLNYGKVRNVERLQDEEVFGLIPEQTNHKVAAYPEGTVIYIDTVGCLHYGSRTVGQPRYLLMLQYLSPCRADLRPVSLKQHVRPTDSMLRKLLLDPDYLPAKSDGWPGTVERAQ